MSRSYVVVLTEPGGDVDRIYGPYSWDEATAKEAELVNDNTVQRPMPMVWTQELEQ